MKALSTVAAALAAGAVIAACTVHQSEPPPLAGPSTLGQLITVTATPDSIMQNGGDQSTIRVTVTGPSGQPLSNVPIQLQTVQNGVPADFGRLSAKSIITGSNGVATAIFTAPAAPPTGTNIGTCASNGLTTPLPGSCVSIVASATGTDFSSANTQSVTIRLVPPGVILPPSKTPKALFIVVPESGIQVGQSVFFDASGSCAEVDANDACLPTSTHTITSYAWNFGDGSTATGVQVKHAWSTAGVFPVTLTVTNETGGAASTTKPLTIAFPSSPTADFVFSPSAPNVLDTVSFNAAASKAAPTHSIASYSWDFGDNTPTATGLTTTHQYTLPGSYNVVLTVTDDTGQKATTSKSVPVGSGQPTASIVITKGAVGSGVVKVDASGSTAVAGATIVRYDYDFGDATPIIVDGGTSQTHTYAGAGPFTLKVTVIDNLGRKGTTSAQVSPP
ncbi:MAG TPA: PKD domain-containing protein [Vicinamibacterales bacterium]|nr:PKD domain-containing protein [Vicinamibacterales bacterium]